MNDLRKTQESFARKAQAQPNHRFGDLYHLICQADWIREALQAVLRNAGSRTAGIDGLSRKHLSDAKAQTAFIEGLRQELHNGTYRARPVRRHWIPKANGKQRPLGIPTLKDRVVQMELKMLLEPIWESDFLDCSNGFRPGRRTMDCLALCRSRITTQNKYLWVIEGDIKGCFDHVQHAILMKLVRRRVKDERINGLIEQMLKAGLLEGGLFQHTPEGTPQGGILSPLLANIYLHEFDQWWWDQYGKLSLKEKAKRRQAGVGNCLLTRYADDFILLCNGPRPEVERIRDEVKQVLWDKLRLELSMEKTRITHVTEGFDFLGFHLEWKLPTTGNPWLRVTPSHKSIARFKRTIKDMTRRNTLYQAPLDKVRSLNRVMQGWNRYYEYANATQDASKLTFWANRRLFVWLRKRHKRGAGWVMRTFRRREKRGRTERWNLGVKDEAGGMVFLYQLTDLPRRAYHQRKHPHPYLETTNPPGLLDTAFPHFWDGHTDIEQATWAQLRLAVLERDNHRCVVCGSTSQLHVHHLKARRQGGTHQLDNLQTLCAICHAQTSTYGRPCRTGSTHSRRAG
ncbi:MAG: group II intron reverse transcriptase/maturase [Chloroflexi bacterium]|nr:group II intron reverse transcriptase/maturase [Chloroflexota bacterium]